MRSLKVENEQSYNPRGSKTVNGKHGESDRIGVRTALKNLPTASCPTGFEFRLAKRLDSSGSRTENRWYLSWAGAGLGFAAVIVFFIFTFDFSSGPTGGVMQAEAPQNSSAPVNPVMDDPATQVAVQTPSDATNETPVQSSTELAATPKDTSQRGKLPEGHYETVGGQNPSSSGGQ
jgi:hypothetical protein